MRARLAVGVTWMMVLAVARLSAHDFWLAAENWTPAAVRLQLLADGKHVSGAAVSAVSGEQAVRAQTDKDGRATFTIDRAGAWLIKTVHMVRLPQPAEAEWESYWVTLAFHTAAN
jgi:Domain of unknown function (DUF4198)